MQPQTYGQKSNCVKQDYKTIFSLNHKRPDVLMCICLILLCHLPLYCQILTVPNTKGPLKQVTETVKMITCAVDMQTICVYYVFLTVKTSITWHPNKHQSDTHTRVRLSEQRTYKAGALLCVNSTSLFCEAIVVLLK